MRYPLRGPVRLLILAGLLACRSGRPSGIPLDGALPSTTDEVEASWGTSASMPHARIAGYEVIDVAREYRPTGRSSRPLLSPNTARRDSAAWRYSVVDGGRDTARVTIAFSRRGTYRQGREGEEGFVRTLDEVTRVVARIVVAGDTSGAWRAEWSWRTGADVPGRCDYTATLSSATREYVVRPVPTQASLVAGCTIKASPPAEGFTLLDQGREVAAIQVAAAGLLGRNRLRAWLPRVSPGERLLVATALGVLALRGIPGPFSE